MVIRQAKVSARGELRSGEIGLVLHRLEDGWTYRVEEVSGDPFYFTWRSRTPEQASRKLMDIYHPKSWELRVIDGDTVEGPAQPETDS